MAGLGVAVIAAVALGVLLLVVVVATPSGETLGLDLEPGECFDLADDDGADAIGTVETTPCGEPHEAEAVEVGELDPADGAEEVPRPVDDVLFERVVDAIHASQTKDLPPDPTRFAWTDLVPHSVGLGIGLPPLLGDDRVKAGAGGLVHGLDLLLGGDRAALVR